jgi:hypothetical protein
VQILEDENERAVLGERLEQPAPSRERFAAAIAAAVERRPEADQRPEVALDPFVFAGIGEDFFHHRVQLGFCGGFVVRLEDAGLRLRDLAERPVAQALAVRERPALAPPDQLRISVHDLEQLGNEPALADPRDADQGYELRRQLAAASSEGIHEQAELALPADELRAEVLLHVETETGLRGNSLPDLDRLGLALRLDGIGRAVLDRVARRAVGGLSHEDSVDRRGGLQARCGVDDVAGRHSLALVGSCAQGDEGLAGRDGAAELQLERRLGLVQLADRIANRQRGANGSLGVVLVGDRGAEDGHHRVADELLHGAAVPLDLAAQPCVVGRQGCADVLRV